MIVQEKNSWPLWIILMLVFFVVLNQFTKLSVPVTSNDLWWHIALGRQVLESGSLITDHSIYTWTPATAYHTYSSWLSDIILYLIDEVTGTAGLLLLRYCIFFGMLLLAVYFAVKRYLYYHPLTWVIVLLGICLGGISYLIKPELFSMGFMTLVVWLYFHVRSIGDRGWWLSYFFPLILIVWINVHGAFFISSIFFLSTIVGELLNLAFSPGQAMGKRLRRHYFASMLLCIPALVVNPYGIDLPLSILDSVVNQSAQDFSYIGAYKPTYILNKAPHYILDYLILAMLVFVILLWQKLKLRQTDWVVILSVVVFSALFTQMIRTTYFLAPVFVFSSLDLLATRTDSILWPKKNVGKHVITIVSVIIIALISWRIINYGKVVITDSVSWFENMLSVSDRFPQEEANYIKSNLKGRRVGNLYDDGGYLIYRLWPEKQVMIDPRQFPFNEWISDYVKSFVEGQEIEEFVKTMDADYWVINYNHSMILEWFGRSDQWAPAYFGPIAAIFVPISGFNGKTNFSTRILNLSYKGHISKVLKAAAVLGQVELAKEIRAIAENNIDNDLEIKEQFLHDIDSFILGLQAQLNQDLENAAKHFSKTKSIHYGLNMSARLYRYLASSAWQQGDYIKARLWSIAAYDVLPKKTLNDIYNLALTDWHVRNGVNSDILTDSNEVSWEIYADFIINERELISEEQQSIVETVEAMKKGLYEGNANLFQQSEFERYQSVISGGEAAKSINKVEMLPIH
ncbi:MAG: hypothetical protein KME36_19975 [Candidatus Thiodiazotropha sp. (ex Lucina pensylvanica)]|nr:hypothetical protein [Candidatus Thiodiazotropha sp. (ex Lucina pensylvanica)]MBT3051067.1 hypothetical protein [Candidatus Thiodiazotropha sp. (ex Codakia orbicularis)]